MSVISPEVINQMTSFQHAVWQSVSVAVSEAMNDNITFTNPLVVAQETSEAAADLSQPFLTVQFAFTNTPGGYVTILIPQQSTIELANLYGEGEPVTSVEDSTIAMLRPFTDAIVTGLCQAASNASNESIIASELAVKFQMYAPTPNLASSGKVVRTNVALEIIGLNDSIIWLMDEDTARMLCNMPAAAEAEPESMPFTPFEDINSFGGGQAAQDPHQGLELLLDIPLEISVELGRMKMQVRDVVELGSGSIIEIDKAAGEPVDVLVNGRLVARGEVVVIEDNFGVRITEILTPQERLQRLNEAA